MYNIHLNVKVTFLGIYIVFMWELDIISVNIKVNLNVNVKENIHVNVIVTFKDMCRVFIK